VSARPAAAVVAPTCAGTSNGFLGMLAYAGAALAGLPLSLVVRRYGYNAFFLVLLTCCAATAALVLPLVRHRSYEQDHA
jgi:MFS transporter, OPA family, sugar phosphate sensor protein UhpC